MKSLFDLPQRIQDRIMPCPTTGCWLWPIGLSHGYGTALVDGRTIRVHRYTYEQLVGPIPDGLQLDHLCRMPSCCNPLHLEPVTARENVLRSNGIAARLARQTHCKRDHPLSGDNLRIDPKGSRRCLACERQYRKDNEPLYRLKKKLEKNRSK